MTRAATGGIVLGGRGGQGGGVHGSGGIVLGGHVSSRPSLRYGNRVAAAKMEDDSATCWW